MRGIGIQPAGTTSAGFGDPTHSTDDTTVILANVSAGGSFGSRKIDPKTLDYVWDEDERRLVGMNNIQQLVQLAIFNAAPALQEIDKLDGGFERAMTAILTGACAPIVAQGLIEVLGVTTRMNVAGGLKGGQAITVFRWRDLTTGQEQEESV